MIEFSIFINAAKFLMSKEVRASAASITDAIKRSPQWQKDLVTVEAVLGLLTQERSILVRDLLLSKLRDLDYAEDIQAAFANSYTEIVRNAFEHGLKCTRRKEVRIVTDVCQSFIASTIRCPGADMDPSTLERWLDDARAKLAEDKFRPRGRGLLLVQKTADALFLDPPDGVKFIIYRDQVRLQQETLPGKSGSIVLLTIVSGINSPAFSKRLHEWFDDNAPPRLILCLDKSIGGERVRALADDLLVERISQTRSLSGSTSVAVIVLPRFKDRAGLWRIVCEDSGLLQLLPEKISHADIAGAVGAIEFYSETHA